MKNILLIFVILFTLNTSNAQASKDTTLQLTKPTVVEAACGQCQFHLKTQKGCDLAVKINGVAYFVDGSKIDDHGDAHAKDGFCNAIRKATVVGTVVDNRFIATSFTLVPEAAVPKKKAAKKEKRNYLKFR
jgi:hypothetical protein